MRAHKDETVKIESAATGFSPAVMAKEYDLTIGMFKKDCRFDAQGLATLARSFRELNVTDGPLDMTKVYTDAFQPNRAPAAKRSITPPILRLRRAGSPPPR